MNKTNAFLVVSRYAEDISWIDNYTDNYLICNRGEFIRDDPRIISVPNIGGNQRDIVFYIYQYYDELPPIIGFLQANPFDHCRSDVFDKLIGNKFFTSLEYYGPTPANNYEGRTEEGEFLERNNDWYIPAVVQTCGVPCRYDSFDQFMFKYFENYEHLEWVKFPPGSQFIIEKERALFYPKSFWKHLMDEMFGIRQAEAFIIERALWLIFNNYYKLRKEFYE
jgi:hypothetical protein